MPWQEAKQTPLYDMHVALGGRMVPFGGFLMPLQYEGIIREHQAARQGAVLFDTCHMGEILVTGPAALNDLENLVTCDVASMAVGQCRYGLMCNEAGGVLDDLVIYRLEEREFMLVVNASTQDGDFAWVRSRLSSGSEAANLSGQTAKVDLQGPQSPRIMEKLMEETIAGLKYYRFMRNRFRGGQVMVSRTGYTGEVGFEFYGTAEQAVRFWNACMALGAKAAGLGARDTLRLEMGMPLYGHELDANRNAGESGFARAISGAKRFVGSDVVLDKARRKAILVGLEFDGRQAARNGDGIADDAGRGIGAVTSGSFAPSLGKAIALGYVAAAFGRSGAAVTVRTARPALRAWVAEVPFYKQATGRRPVRDFL